MLWWRSDGNPGDSGPSLCTSSLAVYQRERVPTSGVACEAGCAFHFWAPAVWEQQLAGEKLVTLAAVVPAAHPRAGDRSHFSRGQESRQRNCVEFISSLGVKSKASFTPQLLVVSLELQRAHSVQGSHIAWNLAFGRRGVFSFPLPFNC